MKLFIPSLGTKLKLNKPWKFTLYDEYRNAKLIEGFKSSSDALTRIWFHVNSTKLQYGSADKICTVELPIDTILSISRYYIKKGAGDYDSLTFTLPKKGCPNAKYLEGSRFWVKLNDINESEFDFDVVIEEAKKVKEVAI